MIITIRCLFHSRCREARLHLRAVVQRAIQPATKLADVVDVSVKTIACTIDALPITNVGWLGHSAA